METELRPDWTGPAWLAAAREWIHAELAGAGLAATGEIEQTHMTPWSTVLRVPTADENLWFKAAAPALAHEPGVVRILSERLPGLVPPPLAVDLERGWLLQEDGGSRLREMLDGRPDPRLWEEALGLYAELQLVAAADRDDLLAAGCPDRRLAGLTAQYVEAVSTRPTLSAEERGKLLAHGERVAALAPELAAYELPETIQHDDFHDAQIFVRDGRYRFLDWGDSCVAHPFFTLVVTLSVLSYKLGVEESSPALHRYRDAYLEPWTRLRPRAELLEALPAALALGAVCRALTWNLVATTTPPPLDAEPSEATDAWLRSLLEED